MARSTLRWHRRSTPAMIGAGRGVNQEGEPQSRPVAWLDRLSPRAVFERRTDAYQRVVIASDAPATQGMSH
ncbi:MAG TPA: hypothetical protein VFQ89_07890 [Candidatus Binatia bacterium]|nr:hypothetical protein [Candidatus Binatia bacterium]